MKRPEVRESTLFDIPMLCGIAKEFVDESNWPLTYTDDIAVAQLYQFITQENSTVLIVTVGGEPAGGAILVAAQDMTLEKQGFIHKFYIKKDFRKTLAAFALIRGCVEWLDDAGCPVSFTTSTSGMDERAICAFTKLMRKFDYHTTGPTLYRVKNG